MEFFNLSSRKLKIGKEPDSRTKSCFRHKRDQDREQDQAEKSCYHLPTLTRRPLSTERPLLTFNESFILGELFSPLFRISTHLHLHQTQTLLRLCPSPRPMSEILRVATTANSLLRPKPEAEHRFDEQQKSVCGMTGFPYERRDLSLNGQ